MSRYTHRELVERGHRYLMKTHNCSFAFKEIRGLANEIPDIIGFMIGRPASFLIECKTSRADFLADCKKGHRQIPEIGMGSYRSFLCPPGVIEISDLPDKWGLLHIENDKIRWKHGYKKNGWDRNLPFHFERNVQAEWSLLGSALRRMEIRGHLDEIYDGIPDGFYDNKIPRPCPWCKEVPTFQNLGGFETILHEGHNDCPLGRIEGWDISAWNKGAS